MGLEGRQGAPESPGRLRVGGNVVELQHESGKPQIGQGPAFFRYGSQVSLVGHVQGRFEVQPRPGGDPFAGAKSGEVAQPCALFGGKGPHHVVGQGRLVFRAKQVGVQPEREQRLDEPGALFRVPHAPVKSFHHPDFAKTLFCH